MKKIYLLLFFILLLGFLFRIYGMNWDQGYHLHPDERAIVLFTLPLSWPQTITDFFSPKSSLNPHFFAYGSLPLYVLKIASTAMGIFNLSYTSYESIDLVGRALSALFDTFTIAVIYLVGKKIFSTRIGLFAAFIYAISVLPIQLSHFYAVDTMLTCFMLLTLFSLIKLYEKPNIINAVVTGIFFGLAMATKASAVAVSATILLTLALDFLLIFLRQPHKPHIWFPHVPHIIKKLFIEGITLFITAGIIFFICEPYAFLDFSEFLNQNLQQYAMTKDAFTFPYTLQYIGKIPYFYELKNIFLWGEGPLLASFSFIGIGYLTYLALKKQKHDKWAKELVLVVFFWTYFAIVGRFAIGFMRYMLPVYPILSISAALMFRRLRLLIHKRNLISAIYSAICIIGLLIWPLSFITIYNHDNTRVQATNWILKNTKPGKTLAIEHWDDGLPLIGSEQYHMETLQLYNPDTIEKWQMIDQQLNAADDIIIASNRLYVPLQKLTNCATLPPFRCYRQTATYYNDLFSGKLGFRKVAEFAVYPTIPFTNITINDQGADESFTVYDHPKVMIFQKTP